MRNQLNWRLGVCLGWLAAGWIGAHADISYNRKGSLVPGPDDGRIAYVTAQLLAQKHYRQMAFDDAVSSNFFHNYLTTLDPQHLHFLQTDVDGFRPFETTLDDLTQERNAGPGFDIFERFFQRLEQRAEYVRELLKSGPFQFEDTKPILLNRRDAAFPATLDEARALWRDRLRYEYLEEKLALLEERKQAEAKRKPAKQNAPNKETMPEAPLKPPGPMTVDEEVRDKLDRRYARNLKYFAEWDSDDVIQLYLTTLGHVYDPHTDYMGRAALDQFAINMNLSLFGIGAQLRAVDGYCTIDRLLPGGPAEKSKKLKEKERIVAVAQADGEPVDVVDMSLNKVVQLIRGAKGTEVQLTVIAPEGEPASERRVVSLIRDEIPLEEQAAKARLIAIPGDDGQTNRIGVIDLPTFYAPMDIVARKEAAQTRHSTSEDVARLIQKLKAEGIEGLVLDLRRNGGGSLEEAIRLTGLFIKEGPVVQVRDFSGEIGVDKDMDASVLYDGPMVVLTSRGSASASEIVAGALQDYGRALVVGDISTHGKGTVQSLNQLAPLFRFLHTQEDPGALKVTIRKFYRANGESTQLRGVSPHIVLPSVANVLEDVGEAGLENPLNWDTIPSASFEAVNRVQPHLSELRRLSEARVSLSKDFDYIREDMERIRETQDRKTVLLNEAERARELQEARDRDQARKAEQAARSHNGRLIYEITLKNADLPGLPAPLKPAAAASATDSQPFPDDSLAEVKLDEDEESGLQIDPTLDETEQILLDYIPLLEKANVLTAVKQDS
ncbi:MAG: carboxy terminal-processing peptidase [Verrucomicrobia bacterium]|jgi:carboxyl-terminal processing protease|nr:carboxy terminal-processing peptidase [Verrucomicrobiota bacterium]